MTWELHVVRGDATNSAAIHGAKAHVTEVHSLFHHIELDGIDDAPPDELLQRTYTDLQKVPESNSALEQRVLFLKQMESIGCKTWLNDPLYVADFAWPCPHIMVYFLELIRGATNAGVIP